MPAPPLGSEPAIVKATGRMCSAYPIRAAKKQTPPGARAACYRKPTY